MYVLCFTQWSIDVGEYVFIILYCSLLQNIKCLIPVEQADEFLDETYGAAEEEEAEKKEGEKEEEKEKKVRRG